MIAEFGTWKATAHSCFVLWMSILTQCQEQADAERRKSLESLTRMSDAELKNFVLAQLALYGPNQSVEMAEAILLERSPLLQR